MSMIVKDGSVRSVLQVGSKLLPKLMKYLSLMPLVTQALNGVSIWFEITLINRHLQRSNPKQQYKTPFLTLTHLKIQDLRNRKNEYDEVFDDTENCSSDPNRCQIDALPSESRIPDRIDWIALKADRENECNAVQC